MIKVVYFLKDDTSVWAVFFSLQQNYDCTTWKKSANPHLQTFKSTKLLRIGIDL